MFQWFLDRAIRKQARYWYIKLDTSSEIETMWPKFEAWLKSSARHREIWFEVEERYRGLELRVVAPMRRHIEETGITLHRLLKEISDRKHSGIP